MANVTRLSSILLEIMEEVGLTEEEISDISKRISKAPRLKESSSTVLGECASFPNGKCGPDPDEDIGKIVRNLRKSRSDSAWGPKTTSPKTPKAPKKTTTPKTTPKTPTAPKLKKEEKKYLGECGPDWGHCGPSAGMYRDSTPKKKSTASTPKKKSTASTPKKKSTTSKTPGTTSTTSHSKAPGSITFSKPKINTSKKTTTKKKLSGYKGSCGLGTR